MSDPNPRESSRCATCEDGQVEYVEQTLNARGELVSLFECDECGHEVLVR